MQNAFSRSAGAPCARSENFFKDFFYQELLQLILMHQISKQSFLGRLCSERNAFLRAAGAPCARSGFFFMDQFLLPRRFQRGIARPHQFTVCRKDHHKSACSHCNYYAFKCKYKIKSKIFGLKSVIPSTFLPL